MVVLVTATLTPNPQMYTLKLIEKEKRIEEYITGLNFLIKSKAINKIVFCDNSGDIEAINRVKLAIEKENISWRKKLEVMQFLGNNKEIIAKGKGFGEGELVEYALSNSELLKNENEFIKLTGRIIVKNIDSIIKKMKPEVSYINPVKIYGFDKQMDTKFYKMNIAFYKENFLSIYKKVNDREHVFIEHLFWEVIKKKKINYNNTTEYPIYIGKSGSIGRNYGTSKIKYFVKNVMCKMNIYKNY